MKQKMSLFGVVQMAQNGDLRAVAALVTHVRPFAYAVAQRILQDSHIAEDVAQDVAVDMVKCIRSLKEPASFPGWISQMARNRARRISARRARVRAEEPIDPELHGTPRRAANASTSNLFRAIDALPDGYREALYMRHVDGLSPDDIAQRLGITRNALRLRLIRGRKLLQRHKDNARKGWA